MTTRWARFARGWIAAVVSILLAAFWHAIAGGTLPGAAGILLCVAFSVVVCVLLAGKTLSLTRLSIAVGASQFMFHALFGMLTDAPAAASAALQHTGAMVMNSAQLPAPTHVMVMNADPRMWAGHAVAAVLTIVALNFGERAFWGLADLAALSVTRLRRVLLVPVAFPARPRPVVSAGATATRHLVVLFSSDRHRGPPALRLAS